MNTLYMSNPDPKSYKCNEIDIPLYYCTLNVGISYAKDAPAGFVCKGNHNSEIFVIIKKNHLTNMNTIAHEAMHVIQSVEEAIRSELKGEASAYLIGWVVEEIIKQLKILKAKDIKKRKGKCKTNKK